MESNEGKTIFIINPKAGKGKNTDRLKAEIKEAAKAAGSEAGIYTTRAPGDGEIFARAAAEEAEKSGSRVRLIACGGDGTLNEVLNGVIGKKNAAIGVMPTGTGNDFVRNFPVAGDFLSATAQLAGEERPTDVMECSGLIGGRSQVRACINMFNIGFDCNVVDLTARLKKYPLIKGSFAYLVAVAGMFIKKKGANLRLEADGEVIQDGPLLLTAAANGSYCGGGVKSSPEASIDDGLMDLNVIYDVTRLQFLKKFPYYSKGTHMELPDIGDILLFKKCKELKITPLDGSMRLCVDGEISDAGEVTIRMLQRHVSFIIPKAKEVI